MLLSICLALLLAERWILYGARGDVSWMSAASPDVGCVSTSWGRMIVCCLGAVWSSGVGLTRCSLGENCAGGDDDGEWGECTR